ncbi:Cyclic pyranopterin monophosphate synthase accessory protein [Escovopsis weberi]|uniref:cyclic pyranopterin monophosphate synthase n=1 Tax=Escovopsis weberi TaxID=150374 RepID=A0A0M9VTD0_ESCWE|nr:Cyclic pyranopterin monophosphate synthase accessory protein [Escovopsis weberi]
MPLSTRRLLHDMPLMLRAQQTPSPRLLDHGQSRFFSATPRHLDDRKEEDDHNKTGGDSGPRLTHVAASGSAQMVSISQKQVTSRIATAVCRVRFSSDTAVRLIRDNAMKKGDVLGVARVAGIMAAKRTADLIPLCHPIAISKVGVEVDVRGAREVAVRATVACEGKTGVEMEALTAASTAALTVYDMCKAVDREMEVGGLRVVLKDGGRSGRWEVEEEEGSG